jgi:hypothetical protein
MKIRYVELVEKRAIVMMLLQAEEKKLKSIESGDSKLKYFILKWDKEVSKLLQSVQKHFSDIYNDEKEFIEITNAFEKDGILIKNGDKYSFSRESALKVLEETKSLKNKIEIQMEEYEIEFQPLLFDIENHVVLDEFTTEQLKNIFIK